MKLQLPNFKSTKILVVGDVMLDKYWHGQTSRISPEAPVPVVKVGDIMQGPGGAGNVALNLSSIGVNTTLLSLVGDDEHALELNKLLKHPLLESHLLTVPGLPTTTKFRVLGRNQQLIRLDFEKNFDAANHDGLLNQFANILPKVDAVILSDYGKGVLREMKRYIDLIKQAKIPLLVDPKSEDFSIYSGATVITPNLKEFETVVGRCYNEGEIIAKGMELIQENDLAALLITRGAVGMTLLQRDQLPLHLSTHAREVYDVTGAGDTVISMLAAALASGASMLEAAKLANTAAGIVVRKLGAASVSISELRRELQRQQDSELGILTEEELLLAVEDARAHGESVVMTNGCFDLLHPGHLSYLEQAKRLGKRLIVAVNSDDSVRRLKGDPRPVNTLADRMTMLAGLRAVDWVVPFCEDTPERLIGRVLPDVLVKGGDWKVEQIAGHKQVLANGGEVKILSFRSGYSTTKLIQRITDKIVEKV